MDVNRIRIITAIQGRHEVLNAFFWQLEYLRKETGFSLPVTLVYSDDEDLHHIEQYLTEDCEAFKTPNNPLSEKHNQLIRKAYKRKDWDCLLHLGSDDLASAEYIRLISELELKEAIYGVNEIYFYNLPTHVLKKFQYQVRTLGAGRVYPRSVIKRLKGKKYKFRRPYYGLVAGDEQYIPNELKGLIADRSLAVEVENSKELLTLWIGKKNSGLDNEAARLLRLLEIPQQTLSLEYPMIVDLKSRDNITPWERIKGVTIPTPHDKERLREIAPNIEL